MERIVPANLDGDELWRRNSEYVDADSYDASIARSAKLEAALRELTDACLAEFGDGEAAPREPDDSSVYAGVPNGQGITFGMLRRARAVLAEIQAV